MDFPVWKTITIGGKTAADLIAEMESKGYKIDRSVREMMGNEAFITSSEPRALQLVRPSVRELGFHKWAKTKEIWDRALELKLQLCPAEVGPHLRLAHADQQYGAWYWIGMKLIPHSDGRPRVFGVGYDSHGRRLFIGGEHFVPRFDPENWFDLEHRWDPVYGWVPEDRIVFEAPPGA